MRRLILSEEWEKDEPARQEGLKYMMEHPLSLEQKLEQVRRNMEIRRQNIEEIQEKNSENDSKAINDSPLNNKNESKGNFHIIDADVKYDTH